MVLSISPVDWAAEWLRPVSPSYKYVGPVLAEPGKALPAHLEVNPRPLRPKRQDLVKLLCCLRIISG